MCLAVPVKLVGREGTQGEIELSGVRRRTDLRLLPEAVPGQYVLFHAGFAIQVVDEEYYREYWELRRQFEEMERAGQG